MSEVIWHWTRGNIDFFTKQIDLVEEAIKEGKLVKTLVDKPHIFIHSHI